MLTSSSSGLAMSDVLLSEGLLSRFMEYMDGEGDRDLVEFWAMANNYRWDESLKKCIRCIPQVLIVVFFFFQI